MKELAFKFVVTCILLPVIIIAKQHAKSTQSTTSASSPAICENRVSAFFVSDNTQPVSSNSLAYDDVAEEDCIKMCSDNRDSKGRAILCASFSYDHSSSVCKIYRSKSFPDGELETEPAIGKKYFEKFCIDEDLPVECGDAHFLRADQSVIIGYAKNVSIVESLQECVAQCLREHFTCKSAMYFYEEGECITNTESAFTKPSSFALEESDKVIYFQNGCNFVLEMQKLFDRTSGSDVDSGISKLNEKSDEMSTTLETTTLEADRIILPGEQNKNADDLITNLENDDIEKIENKNVHEDDTDFVEESRAAGEDDEEYKTNATTIEENGKGNVKETKRKIKFKKMKNTREEGDQFSIGDSADKTSEVYSREENEKDHSEEKNDNDEKSTEKDLDYDANDGKSMEENEDEEEEHPSDIEDKERLTTKFEQNHNQSDIEEVHKKKIIKNYKSHPRALSITNNKQTKVRPASREMEEIEINKVAVQRKAKTRGLKSIEKIKIKTISSSDEANSYFSVWSEWTPCQSSGERKIRRRRCLNLRKCVGALMEVDKCPDEISTEDAILSQEKTVVSAGPMGPETSIFSSSSHTISFGLPPSVMPSNMQGKRNARAHSSVTFKQPENVWSPWLGICQEFASGQPCKNNQVIGFESRECLAKDFTKCVGPFFRYCTLPC